jgi:hypothetical protein
MHIKATLMVVRILDGGYNQIVLAGGQLKRLRSFFSAFHMSCWSLKIETFSSYIHFYPLCKSGKLIRLIFYPLKEMPMTYPFFPAYFYY